jgi:glycosyltransferase involved in cell wall biosynthesis
MLKKLFWMASGAIYHGLIVGMVPLNYLLSKAREKKVYPKSVLHISYMVHIPYNMAKTLRKGGLKADYLAVGTAGPTWNKSDFHLIPSRWPPVRAIQEFVMLWKVVAKYQIIHSHFMIMLSQSGWELPLLKKMGRRIVVHYRGCEIRDKDVNMSLHPESNICEECDYAAYCISDGFREKRRLASKYGDAFLVTTPDLKEFFPKAIHLPFFVPEIPLKLGGKSPAKKKDGITILHVTNHPGIEGTEDIERVIERLQKKGYFINFVFLKGISYDRVLMELSMADLSIGKIKMGYYANFQIESMLMGVPAITYVREEFLNEDLKESGFIFADLNGLEETIKDYLDNPDKLEQKKRIARDSILRLHDNEKIAKRLISIYDNTRLRKQ